MPTTINYISVEYRGQFCAAHHGFRLWHLITTSAVIVWRMRNYVTWKRLWPIVLTFIVVSSNDKLIW